MKGFSGFPQKGHLTKIPGLFFSELLPQIDSLAELKVTLYCFWRLQQKRTGISYLWETELSTDQVFLEGLGARKDEQLAALRNGLERTVARGTLLHVQVQRKGREEALYFFNTERGRAAVKGIEAGQWQPDEDPDLMLDLSVERPNIYTLYEQNIGPLTPLLSENLRDMEAAYPPDWIEEAVEIAVGRNRRSLAYVEAILKRWKTEGRGEEKEHLPRDGTRFISGKYRDEINY